MAFDNALKAFTFGGSDDRDAVAFLKNIVDTDNVAEVFAKGAVPKFEYFAFGRGTGFFEVDAQGRWGVFYFALAEGELQGRIAVVILGANLRYHARTCFYDRTSNVFAVVIDTGHADFFSNQTVHARLRFLYLNDIATSEKATECKAVWVFKSSTIKTFQKSQSVIIAG